MARRLAGVAVNQLRSPAARVAEPTQLRLAGEADIGAVERVLAEARAAATRGGEVCIHCADTTCFDLGALQLLCQGVHASQLEFASPQRARVVNGWLALVAT